MNRAEALAFMAADPTNIVHDIHYRIYYRLNPRGYVEHDSATGWESEGVVLLDDDTFEPVLEPVLEPVEYTVLVWLSKPPRLSDNTSAPRLDDYLVGEGVNRFNTKKTEECRYPVTFTVKPGEV